MKYEEIFESEESLEELYVPKSKVIRKGKLKKKRICPAGYKLENDRCVRMSSLEKVKWHRQNVKTSRKNKASRIRHQKRSNKIRQRKGLD